MRKRILASLLSLTLLFSVSACGREKAIETTPIETPAPSASEAPTADSVISKEEMLSDYDSMWETVKENYPFWGALSRTNPDSPNYYQEVMAQYRKQIEDMELSGDAAMIAYIETIAYSLYEVCGSIGHVSIVNPNAFADLGVYKKYADEMPSVQPWVDVIERQEVIDFYQYFEESLIPLIMAQEQDKASTTEVGEVEESEAEEDTPAPEDNLTTEILRDGKIAYLKVNSFDDAFMDEDLPKIDDFIGETSAAEHLIIDIRSNGGGNTVYWEDAFVRPFLQESITTRDVRLMKDTELAVQFYGSDYENTRISVDDVLQDPKFTALQLEDMKGLQLARELPSTLVPLTGKNKFDGKVWLLVGPDVYSSAESFAVFCKKTGFATLVGQATGGSNSGGPILYELPFSHMLVEFDVEYCLNADGSCNQEVGTTPDIEAEDALQEVLQQIQNE